MLDLNAQDLLQFCFHSSLRPLWGLFWASCWACPFCTCGGSWALLPASNIHSILFQQTQMTPQKRKNQWTHATMIPMIQNVSNKEKHILFRFHRNRLEADLVPLKHAKNKDTNKSLLSCSWPCVWLCSAESIVVPLFHCSLVLAIALWFHPGPPGNPVPMWAPLSILLLEDKGVNRSSSHESKWDPPNFVLEQRIPPFLTKVRWYRYYVYFIVYVYAACLQINDVLLFNSCPQRGSRVGFFSGLDPDLLGFCPTLSSARGIDNHF